MHTMTMMLDLMGKLSPFGTSKPKAQNIYTYRILKLQKTAS